MLSMPPATTIFDWPERRALPAIMTDIIAEPQTLLTVVQGVALLIPAARAA